MKRLLSVICALAIVLGVAILPTAVNADSVIELSDTYLHKVTKTNEGGEDVYTTNTWDAGSITFGYKIQAGYRYYLSFDYMGKATSAAQVPMATTVATDTTKLNDSIANEVPLNVPESASNFTQVWVEISGEDLLAGGGEYLIINWKHLTSVSKFKNFKIMRTVDNTDAPKASKLHRFTAGLENGEIVYTGQTWTACSLTFDYEIKSGYSYFLSFDFTGHNWTQSQNLRASTVATPGTYLNEKITTGVEIPLPSQQTTWYNVSVELKAEDLLSSGGKYLALNFIHSGNVNRFKNFKIQAVKMADDGYIHPVTLKKGEVNKSIVDGEIIYAMKTWACPSMVFDYELEAGKEYVFEFEYRGHSWAQNCVPSIMAAPNLDFQLTASLPQYRTSLGITSTRTAFTKFQVVFESDPLLAGGGKYFTIFAQNLGDLGEFKNMKLYVNPASELVGEQTLNVSALKAGGEVTESTEEGVTVYTFAKNWCTPSITFDFRMKPGKTYAVNYDYILNTTFYGNSFLEPSFTAVETKTYTGSKVYDKNISAGLTATSVWTNKTTIINADDIITDQNRFLMFYAVNPTGTNGLKVRNFTIAEIDPNELLSNGTFESGMTFWKNYDGTATLSEDAVQGKYSVNLKGGSYSLLSHGIALESNKNYKLSFQYKGTFAGLPNWGISKGGASMEPANLMYYGKLSDTTEWKTHSVVFATGEENAFAIMFQTGGNCDFFVDNVVLEETTEKADALTPISSPVYTENEAANRFWHWDADTEEHNLVVNGDFEKEGNWSSLTTSGTIKHITYDDAYSGEKVLKFEAVGLSEISYNYLYVDCKPNTEYMLSVWHKGENWSDTNKNDLRWSIADPITGKMLFTYRTSLRGYNLNAWDNEWHRTTLKFNSGNNETIALVYQGANSVAYIDNLQIFEYAHRKNGRPFVMVQKQPSVTAYLDTDDNIYCDEKDNIFKNSSFEKSDISFWNGEDSMGYIGTVSENYVTLLDWDGTAEIGNSESSHGKALKYKENSKYTGKPLSTSYIKYVDVKTDTEYTFVADFRVDKEGAGRFGLLSVNDFWPRIIGEWKTFKDENYDPDHKWQTVAFTFNSNEFDRLAFMLQDKGGEAFVDNIRLFETSKGKQSTQTEVKLTSDTYKLTEGLFDAVKGTTVGSVKNTFNVKDKIRVFDANGNEINDMNRLVGNGVEFRYMDGISVLETATAVLMGDVNGDGLIDGNDAKAILKHALNTETIAESMLKAADLNGDKIVDINDAALLSGEKGKKIETPVATFEGPEEVPANNEFEVTYYLNGKDVRAVQGVVNFDKNNMSLVSLESEFANDWVVEYTEEDGKITFAASNYTGKNLVNGKTALFTVTFKAGNNAGETSKISVTDQLVTAGDVAIEAKDIGYSSPAKEEKPETEDNVQNDNDDESAVNNSGNNDFDFDFEDDYDSGSVDIVEDEGPSNNNRLASLIVKNATITPEFDPETKNYEATVPFEVEELIIEAVTADENATMEIKDTKLIYVGKNITKIVVHSESGLKRTYKIYTTRQAPVKGGANNANANGGLPVWAWALIGVGAAAVIAAGVFVLIIIKKRKGEKK